MVFSGLMVRLENKGFGIILRLPNRPTFNRQPHYRSALPFPWRGPAIRLISALPFECLSSANHCRSCEPKDSEADRAPWTKSQHLILQCLPEMRSQFGNHVFT